MTSNDGVKTSGAPGLGLQNTPLIFFTSTWSLTPGRKRCCRGAKVGLQLGGGLEKENRHFHSILAGCVAGIEKRILSLWLVISLVHVVWTN